jgi:hypothetical protein
MRWLCRFFAGLAVFAVAIAARAEEGGFGHYAPGSFASFIDVLPGKPSLGAFNYFTYYNGNAGVSRQFEIAGLIAANVSATSYADSLGPFWVTPLRMLGAYYAPGVALPFVWTDVKARKRRKGSRLYKFYIDATLLTLPLNLGNGSVFCPGAVGVTVAPASRHTM